MAYDYIVSVGADVSDISKNIVSAVKKADNSKVRVKCDDSEVRKVLAQLSHLDSKFADKIMLEIDSQGVEKSLTQIKQEVINDVDAIKKELASVNFDSLNAELEKRTKALERAQDRRNKYTAENLNSSLEKEFATLNKFPKSSTQYKAISQSIVDLVASYEAAGVKVENLSQKIQDSLQKLYSAGYKGKFNPTELTNQDQNIAVLKNQVKEIEKQIQHYKNLQIELADLQKILSPNGTGGTGSQAGSDINTANLSKVEELLEAIKESATSVAKALGSIDDQSDAENLIQIFSRLNTEINTLSESLSKVNLNINLSGSGNNQRKVGNATRDALKEANKAYDSLLNTLTKGGNGLDIFKGVDNSLFTRFYNASELLGDSSSLSSQLYYYQELIKVLKEAASLKGINISTWAKDYEAPLTQAVAQIDKVESGAEELQGLLKNISGESQNINLNGLDEQLTEVVAKLNEISQYLREDFNSFLHDNFTKLDTDGTLDSTKQDLSELLKLLGEIKTELITINTTPLKIDAQVAPDLEQVKTAVKDAIQDGQELADQKAKEAEKKKKNTRKAKKDKNKSVYSALSDLAKNEVRFQELEEKEKKGTLTSSEATRLEKIRIAREKDLKVLKGVTNLNKAQLKKQKEWNKAKAEGNRIVAASRKAEGNKKKTVTQLDDVSKAYERLTKSVKEYQRIEVKQAVGKSITGEEAAKLKQRRLDLDIVKQAEQTGQLTDIQKQKQKEYNDELQRTVKLKQTAIDTELQNIADAEAKKKKEKQQKIDDTITKAETKVNTALNDFSSQSKLTNSAEIIGRVTDRINELKSALNNGDISTTKFNSSIDKLISELNQVENEAEDATQALERMKKNAYEKGAKDVTVSADGKTVTAKLVDDAKNITKYVQKYDEASKLITSRTVQNGKEIGTFSKILTGWKGKLGEVVRYLASFGSVYEIFNVLRQGVGVIRDLDDALTEMNKVSDEPLSVLKAYQKESFAIADAVGSTGQQIQQSTADWQRLGESLSQAKESAKASNILLNVSEFDSIDSATESLVSMSQAYSELDKMDIIDKLNNIGNNFSISTDGIATALQKSASALKTANNSIDESIALITAGNAVVQNPDSVGAGIRTIALRIQGTEEAKAELEEMGEEVDDYVVQTASKIDATVRNFTAVASNNFKGVSVLDSNGNYRSTYQILQDIADIYEEIVATDKQMGTNHLAGLLETLAGKNRSNIAASIIQNGDMLRSVYQDSQNSEGSALEENQKYLDSISGHLDQLKNKWQEVWSSTAGRDSVNMVLDLAKGLLDIVDTIGLLPTAGIFGAIFGTFYNYEKTFPFISKTLD